MLKKFRYALCQKELRKRALDFLFGNKMLCEKTEKRINELICSLNKLYKFQLEHKIKVSIDTAEDYLSIVDGLNGLLEGTEKGFTLYENNKTVEKLKNLIK